MAKIKFSLTPNPTYKAAASIPIAGSSPARVEFTFRHRTRDQFTEFLTHNEKAEDVDVICGRPKVDGVEQTHLDLGIATNWDLEEPFTRENVEQLIQNYPGAAKAIVDKYMAETGQVRLGNFG